MQLVVDEAARSRMVRGLEEAHDRALERMRQRAQAEAPRRTGEYAANMQVARNERTGALFNPLPQAGAVERGADVGPRRGPHMRGAGTIRRAGAEFPAHMSEALRGG